MLKIIAAAEVELERRGSPLLRLNLHERLIDQLGPLLERVNGDALIVPVHAPQILRGDGVRVNSVNGNATAAPGAGIGSCLK